MTILLSMCYLVHRSGAELFVRDLALSLNALGHSVVVFAPVLGEMAEELRLRCIACVTDLESVAAAPDVIIGSTQQETALCLAHFPGVPAISVCHDRVAAHGQPPRLSRIRRHVAVDENCRERLVLEHGIPAHSVVVIHNGVDLERFRPRPPLPERPARAAIFSNYATWSRDTEAVAAACAERGIALDVIGAGSGNPSREPAELLGGYDLVFAKARCAMEALAVGCAVIVLNEGQGLAGLVTPERFEEWHRWNFGRRLLQRPIGRAAVGEAIDGYSPAAAAAASRLMREHGSLGQMAAAFARLAGEVRAEAAGRPPLDAQVELREFARYVGDALRPPGPASVPVQIGRLLAELERERRWSTEALEQERRRCAEALASEHRGAEALRGEIGRLAAQWDLVQRSVSWKITAPLRWVAGRLGGRR